MQKKIKHIAFIPDGNRRWSKLNNFSNEYEGGINVIKKIVKYFAKDNNIEHLTFYALAKNNIKREFLPDYSFLLNKMQEELNEITENNYNLYFWGNLKELSQPLQNKLININQKEKIFEKTINFFVNYSFKEEFNLCIQGTEKELYEYPSLHLPQINLLIRTGGYHRLSDFCASLLNYAQIVFCSNLWPDFSIHQLNEIIKDLQPQNFGL